MRILFSIYLFLVGTSFLQAQVVATSPVFPTADQAVTIYFDATQGTGGLADCNCDVYLHTGVITNLSTGPSDWKYVPTTWGQTNPDWKMTPVVGSPNVYSYTFTPSPNDYYGVPVTETIEQIALVFRNGTGSLEGKDVGGTDIYVDMTDPNAGYQHKFVTPTAPALIVSLGDIINIKVGTSLPSDIALTDNGDDLLLVYGDVQLVYNLLVTTGGSHSVQYIASNNAGAGSGINSFSYIVPTPAFVEAVPPGTRLGATWIADQALVRLKLQAPGKQYVYAIGSFSNWLPMQTYQMKKSPDGQYFWIDIPATPGSDFKYQYIMDGGLVIADPLSEVVLSPIDDPGITDFNYPNLPAYPVGLTTGNVTLFRPGADPYVWQSTSYVPPAQNNLIIYETLIRDFVATQSYSTIIDTLDYLERLGVTAIQLMPVQEFEGNQSWGYNPSFHMAIDKFYGSVDTLKALIDAAHSRGIAVIGDVVFNHAFGQSPLARMYWDAAGNKPAANNPWLNPDATHPFNVGYDFNHESQATKDYMYRSLQFWIDEYHFDGFRFDLSKGFTQTNNPDNVGAWGAYDASRIVILKQMADTIWATNPNTYIILEHFADNAEEKELSNYGMMIWGNLTNNYRNAAKASGDGNIGWISYKQRGWTYPHVVGYMESHDEERVMRDLTIGTVQNAALGYVLKDTTTALQRMELAFNFFLTIPGPKMIWQFGEMGYEFCINRCASSGACNNCRLDNKPIKWEYLQEERRAKLFNVVSELTHLKTTYPATFNSTDFNLTVSNNFKVVKLNNADMNAIVLGNFGINDASINPNFHHTGTWYEYYSGDSIDVAVVNATLPIQRGEYRIYTDVKLPEPAMGYTTFNPIVPNNDIKGHMPMILFPNPTTGKATLAFELPESETVQIIVLDLMGRAVWNQAFELNIGEQAIALPQLATGQYIVRLISTAGEASKVLMVQE
jgi:Alpha amylase, catalytic domain/Secretion system C-terminal sorting domain